MASSTLASSEGADDSTYSAYESGAAIALCVVAMAAFWLHTCFVTRVPVDDAGISVAYARNLIEGYGLRVTHESAVAEGYSNVTWTFLLVVLEALGADSLTYVRPLGVALAALSFPLVMLWSAAAGSRRLRVEDALGPLIAAAHPSFVYWAQGGLEMGLQVFGIALLAWLGFGPATARRSVAFGLSAALVALTRPEGPLYVLAAGSSWLLRMAADRRRPGPAEQRALVAGALPLLAYLVFRRCYFGEWLPNTYFAKQHWDFDASAYFRNYFHTYRALCLTTFAALPLAWIGTRGSRMSGICNALVLAAFAYFTYHARGDWMTEWRFLSVLAPFHGAALAAGIGGLREGAARVLRGRGWATRRSLLVRRALLALGLAPSALCVYVLVPAQLARSEAVHNAGPEVPITIAKGKPFEPVEAVLAPFKMTHPLVVASDMGGIALGLRHAELWDFAGLTDPAIARHFDTMGPLEDYLRNEGPPTLALAWGPGSFFPSLPLARESYDVIGPNWYLLRGLTATTDPRCPGGKAAVLRQRANQLYDAIASDTHKGDPLRALARWRCAHTYQPDHALPSLALRRRLGAAAREQAERALARGKHELALRYYSLCAVVAIHEVWLSVRCRARAEPLRSQLFAPPQASPPGR